MSKVPLRSISLIFSPYHVGIRNQGPGAGPAFIRGRGLLPALKTLGLPIRELEIEPVDDSEGEIGRSFEVIRRTSKLVTQERNAGSFPIIFSGNCSASVGVAAGLAASENLKQEEIGCVWFDAHDDYNTPDTVMSGYFDSMPIAMLAGQCWKGLLKTVPGHRPLDLQRLVHVAMRDVTEVERARVVEAGFDVVWGSTEKKVDFAGELGGILKRKEKCPTMVHLDLDSLDVSLGKVNKFSAPGGLLEADLDGCLRHVSQATLPASLTVASLDPSFEGAENIAEIAVRVVRAFTEQLVTSGIVAKQQSA